MQVRYLVLNLIISFLVIASPARAGCITASEVLNSDVGVSTKNKYEENLEIINNACNDYIYFQLSFLNSHIIGPPPISRWPGRIVKFTDLPKPLKAYASSKNAIYEAMRCNSLPLPASDDLGSFLSSSTSLMTLHAMRAIYHIEDVSDNSISDERKNIYLPIMEAMYKGELVEGANGRCEIMFRTSLHKNETRHYFCFVYADIFNTPTHLVRNSIVYKNCLLESNSNGK